MTAPDTDDRVRRIGPGLVVIVGVILGLSGVGFYIAINVLNYAGIIQDQQHCTDGTAVHDTAHIIRAEKAELWAAAKRTYADPQRDPYNVLGVLPRPIAVIDIAGKTAHLRVASDMLEGNSAYAEAWLPIFQKYHPQLHEWCAAVLISTPKESFIQTWGNGPYL